MQQTEALNLLKMGKNVFLTGEAGSGKTYLLNKYIQYLKKNNVTVAVTASTGIAATHLHGTTIHSWSGIGVKDQLTDKDLEKLLTTKILRRNYRKTKVLIIDEISMLHKNQLDMIDLIARNFLEGEKPFGGMQVVLCGDFFQLPPVSATSSNQEKYFAFEASSWENGNFYVCYLHEQHRQDNDPLRIVLNDIRSGTAGEHTKVYLRTRYKKEPLGTAKATKLYSRNINVDAINEHELMSIPGQEKIFTMICEGFGSLTEGLKKNCLAPEKLKLKKGAEVMFVKNDSTGRYVNGTRGSIVGFDRNEGWPVVKSYDDNIILASPEEWKYEENGIVRATIKQVPLRLAWAITIHKSQGMTLDAAEMDLGDTFEPGMGYVALSRVRQLSGLKLMNLNEMALKVHPKILQHDQTFKDESLKAIRYLRTLSPQEIKERQEKTITERQEKTITAHQEKTMRDRFEASASKIDIKTNVHKKNEIPTRFMTLHLLKENLSIESIAEKRGLTVGTIISHIEKLRGLKEIDDSCFLHLKDCLPKNDFDVIYTELKNADDGKLKPIYDKFEGKYPYASIQLVRLFVN